MSVSLSVKNVPDDVAERLRERARRNHRSLQGELLMILKHAVSRPLTVAEAYARIKARGLGTPDEATDIIRQMRDTR